ncbi:MULTISPECIES: hypothetical protein [unclassified Streptomyces]|uniref:hypothetical protein n=1 Tax=unclassified Streptomyces TaxID=2593676 RepID=UPI003413BF12
MRRRTLLAATATAGPAALLPGLDEALADTPAPIGAGPLDARLMTARALLSAYRASPGEVRDRPAIRSIVYDLAERHPRTTGVRELHTAVWRHASD